MLLQWLFLQIERYELKLRVHWKIKLLRVLYWNYLLDSIENNTKQTTVINSDRFLCVQWQTIPTRAVLVRWLQLQVYLWGCWKGRLQMLEQVSQSHRILVFWLLDCKKKILSLKFIIHINKHFAWVWKRESYLLSFSLYTTEGMMFLMG